MDERQRRQRIERMKREKQRQLRRRRRQIMLMKRGGVALVALLVLVLVVSGVRSKLGGSEDASSKTASAETSADATQEVTQEVSETPEAEATATTTETTVTAEATTTTTDIASLPGATAAIETPISEDTEVKYSVPGWQVSDNGWWYATANNGYYASGWAIIDGQAYYFDDNGYMARNGWTAIDGTSCYFNESGVYEADKECKMVALTFDDGPGPYTSDLLDTLEQYGAKATFFMLGEQVAEYGEDLLPRMVQLGCELGNHSYDHPNLKKLSEDEITEEFSKTDELIKQYSGLDSVPLARTPYGSQDKTITNLIGKPCIFWSLDTLDWETKDVNSNISTVMDNVSDGEIVLMHDIWSTTVESIKTIVPQLIDEGYQLVTIDELAAAKGVTLENGVTYYDFYSAEEATAGGADDEDDSSSSDDSSSGSSDSESSDSDSSDLDSSDSDDDSGSSSDDDSSSSDDSE